MRPLYLFLALGCGAVWVSCGGNDGNGLFAPGAGGLPGGGGNVTGGSGQTGTGGSLSSTGAGGGASGAIVSTGGGGTTGQGGGGAAGQSGGQSGSAAGGASGAGGKGGGAGMAGMATAGMGGGGSRVVDAGIDAPVVIDAGPKPKIRCGNLSCDAATQFCCLEDPRACLPLGSTACDRNRDRLHCDDASDCSPGQRCCVVDNNGGEPNDAVCRDNCPATVGGRATQILCNPADDTQCPNTDPICSSTLADILLSYAHCH